ncbi:hypothetical protein CA592_06325 [Anoxybacillus flavithermus]|nr:hypothetical protein CA592_06325 [Anoxybacillus flavithermus]
MENVDVLNVENILKPLKSNWTEDMSKTVGIINMKTYWDKKSENLQLSHLIKIEKNIFANVLAVSPLMYPDLI